MFDKQEIPVVKYGYNRNCLLYSHTKTTEKKFKPTKGKPAGVFGGLGRGGDRKKGCLSCVSEKQPFFREVVEQAPERNCENAERFFICVSPPKVKEDGAERAFRPRRSAGKEMR